VSQPTGFPHLPHSQEGYGVSLMLRCYDIYKLRPNNRRMNRLFFAFLRPKTQCEIAQPTALVIADHFRTNKPTNTALRQIDWISRKPAWQRANLNSTSVQSVICPRRLRSLSRMCCGLNPVPSL
jgi:hypothetical protein